MKLKITKINFLTLLLCWIASTVSAQNQDTSMIKIFSMDLEELMNTNVTIATKSDKTVDATPGIVSVITAEEIRNMGARELEDVLQTVPGFELMKNFNGYYGVGIRGVKDTRTTARLLLLINGTPYNQIFYGNSIKTGYNFNLDGIERIEIIRGPGSALYGRNAFSGVVNIITKKADLTEQSYIKGGLGTFNTRDLSGYYNSSYSNQLNASFSFRRIYTDGTAEKFDEGFGNTLWNINHNNFTFNTNVEYGKFTFSGTYFNLNDGVALSESYIRQRSGYYSASYEDKLNPKLALHIQFYGHNEKYMEDLEVLKPGLDVIIPTSKGGNGTIKYSDVYPLGIYYTPEFKEYLYGFETEAKYKFNEKNNLLFGIQADLHGVYDVRLKATISDFIRSTPIPGSDRDSQILYRPGWFKNNGHNYHNLALYVQHIWAPLKSVDITLGGRADYDSQIGPVVNPRLGIVWQPFNKTYLKFLYGRAYRTPSPSEQYKTLGFAFGNESLKPEAIQTLEVALIKSTEKTKNSLSFFRNELKNMIYAEIITSVDPNNKYYNIGKNTSTGIEFENKIVFARNLYSYFNYSYTISENRNSLHGVDTTFSQVDVAPHKISAGINIAFLKHFNLNINGFYRSKMKKYTLSKPVNGQFVEVNDPIGNFLVANATLQLNNLIKNTNISLSSYNILNTKYYSQDNEHLNLPAQPGIQFWLSAIFNLKPLCISCRK